MQNQPVDSNSSARIPPLNHSACICKSLRGFPSFDRLRLNILGAWYGDPSPTAKCTARRVDVTDTVRAMVNLGPHGEELHINPDELPNYLNELFGDPCHSTMKVLGVRYSYGSGTPVETVTPVVPDEAVALHITRGPAHTEAGPAPALTTLTDDRVQQEAAAAVSTVPSIAEKGAGAFTQYLAFLREESARLSAIQLTEAKGKQIRETISFLVQQGMQLEKAIESAQKMFP